MSVRSFRAALMGYGYVSRTFHAPFIESLPEWHLHGIVSSQGAQVRADHPQCCLYAAPQEAFDDPDVDLVVIATPKDTHFALTCAALNAGKHVLPEKPFALTLDEARQMMAKARAYNRHLAKALPLSKAERALWSRGKSA